MVLNKRSMKKINLTLIVLLLASLSYAQINYTNIVPNIVLDGTDTCFIDINSDGIQDLKFTQEDSATGLNGNGVGVTLLHYDIEFIGDNPSYDPSHLYPFKVDSNNVIDQNADNMQWVVKLGGNDVVRVMFIYFFSGVGIGEWKGGVTNGYLGIRLKVNNQWHYGWVRVDVSANNATQITIKDYAYNLMPNEKIHAGQIKDFGPSAVAVSYEDSLCGTVVGFVRRNTSSTLLYNIIYAKNNNGNYDSIAYVPASKPAIFVDRDTIVLFSPKIYRVSTVDSLKGESIVSDSAQSGYFKVNYSSYSANLVYHHFSGLPIENYLHFYRTHSNFYTTSFDSILKTNTVYMDTSNWYGPCRNYIAASVLSSPIYILGYGIMDTLKSNPASSCFYNMMYPNADFTASYPGGSMPTSVSFHDKSETSIKEWSWNFGDGGTSNLQHPSHSYTIAGYYDVSLTVTNCFGADSVVKTGIVHVGISSSEQELGLKLYPNPAKDYIMLELTSNQRINSISMYTLMGKQIMSVQNIYQSSYKLNISNNASGVYFIEIITDKGIVNKKIIIK